MKIGLPLTGPLRDMAGQRFFRLAAIGSLLFWLAAVVLPSWKVVPGIIHKEAVPLHYNIHFGIDTVGPWWQIYVVPAVGLLFIILNVIAMRMTWQRDPMLSYTIAVATVFIEALLFLAMIFIVLLHLTYAA